MCDTSKINEQIHSTGPDIKPMKENYVVTLRVSCDEETDMRRAIELCCDRLTEFSSNIEVTDSHIDYDTPDDNSMTLSETDGETNASRNH